MASDFRYYFIGKRNFYAPIACGYDIVNIFFCKIMLCKYLLKGFSAAFLLLAPVAMIVAERISFLSFKRIPLVDIEPMSIPIVYITIKSPILRLFRFWFRRYGADPNIYNKEAYGNDFDTGKNFYQGMKRAKAD